MPAALAGAALLVAHGSLLVTEIMFRPGTGGEWVEVWNAGSLTVHLEGLSLSDARGPGRLLDPGGISLPPGGVLLVAQDPASFREAWTPPEACRLCGVRCD